MNKPLKAPIHPVPDIVLEQDISILGQKGAGKSITAKGLVERLLDHSRRVIVLDPLNHWYGLRGRPDGTAGFPVVVIGGPNADIPLDPKGGERLGIVLAESDHSFVVDVSDLPKSILVMFSTAFLNSLYVHNRRAVWLVAEEADIFAPQNPAMDGTRNMLDAMDLIARRGRQRGFRLWTVTQRPARLNKDVLSMASALVLMRIRGPQDRDAADDWVKGHANKEQRAEVMNGLAGLEVGQGFVYAPDADLIEKVRFPMIGTLDTSSTPKAGDAPRTIGTMASVDVEALRKALEPPQVVPVQHTPLSADAHAELLGLDVGAIRRESKHAGHVEGYQQGHAAGALAERVTMLGLLRPMVADLERRIEGAPQATIPSPANLVRSEEPEDRTKLTAAVKWAEANGIPVIAKLSETERPTVRKILDVIQRAYPIGLTFKAAALRAGVSPRSSQFRNYEKAVLGSHEVRVVDGRISSKTAPPITHGPSDSPIDAFCSRLPGAYSKMLRVIADAGTPIHKLAIADLAGVSRTSSGLGKGLGELVALELVVRGEGDHYQIVEALR